ncbi:hypothetical protein PXH66_13545 [Synoicihabitans lomoniglobus]|uniref:Uncharacterized protein n=2 Tax=Synoicihabitans lomoniglobus TaxID=2909285 RepID=A0AAE9ZSH0_9BACT|nr:hypothetical protein PXH66_13545 [Opitutaceae bacterium LMO-M01]
MQASLGGPSTKNPLARLLFGLVGLVLVVGFIALLVVVAIPLAIAAVVIGALATVILPRLKRRRVSPTATPEPTAPPRQPRGIQQMKRVEPVAPPRTVESSEVDKTGS